MTACQRPSTGTRPLAMTTKPSRTHFGPGSFPVRNLLRITWPPFHPLPPLSPSSHVFTSTHSAFYLFTYLPLENRRCGTRHSREGLGHGATLAPEPPRSRRRHIVRLFRCWIPSASLRGKSLSLFLPLSTSCLTPKLHPRTPTPYGVKQRRKSSTCKHETPRI